MPGRSVFFLVTLLPLLPGGPEAPPPSPHPLHLSFGRMAVEGAGALCRIHLFKDDLEAALGHFHETPDLTVDASPRSDTLFARYFADRFVLSADGTPLDGRIEDRGEGEDMWWYVIHFRADRPIRTVTVRNALLFERFDDQKNIVKLQHFPSEAQHTLYFAPGAEVYELSFE